MAPEPARSLSPFQHIRGTIASATVPSSGSRPIGGSANDRLCPKRSGPARRTRPAQRIASFAPQRRLAGPQGPSRNSPVERAARSAIAPERSRYKASFRGREGCPEGLPGKTPFRLINTKGPDYRAFRRSGRRVSNPRPSAWEADALPTELRPRCCDFRPPASWLWPRSGPNAAVSHSDGRPIALPEQVRPSLG
jgi:hypothetical protein